MSQPLLQQLDEILSRLRYVVSGDVVLPEDHNDVVDALKKIREYLEKGVPYTFEEPDWKGWKFLRELGNETIAVYRGWSYVQIIIDEKNELVYLMYYRYSTDMWYLRVWSIRDGSLLYSEDDIAQGFGDPVVGAAFFLPCTLPMCKYVIPWNEAYNVDLTFIRVLKNGRVLWEYDVHANLGYYITGVTFSPTGKYIACIANTQSLVSAIGDLPGCKVLVFEAYT